MNNRPSFKLTRTSNIIAAPEQYVTIEIHNQIDKKKKNNHRQSIFRELLVTENLV